MPFVSQPPTELPAKQRTLPRSKATFSMTPADAPFHAKCRFKRCEHISSASSSGEQRQKFRHPNRSQIHQSANGSWRTTSHSLRVCHIVEQMNPCTVSKYIKVNFRMEMDHGYIFQFQLPSVAWDMCQDQWARMGLEGQWLPATETGTDEREVLTKMATGTKWDSPHLCRFPQFDQVCSFQAALAFHNYWDQKNTQKTLFHIFKYFHLFSTMFKRLYLAAGICCDACYF